MGILRALVLRGRHSVCEGGADAEAEGLGPRGGGQGAAGRLGSASELQAALQRIDGKQYPAYHDIEGTWSFPGFVLTIDRAQADAYAAPTRCRVQVWSPGR